MKNADSQVILYAKGWFKRSDDIIKDLKKIYAKRNALEVEYIRNSDVYEMLTHLVFDLCIAPKANTVFNSYPFTNLMIEIFKDYSGLADNDTTTMKRVIEKYLIMLEFLQVNEASHGKITKVLIELDEPDYTIIPRKVDPK